MHKYQRQFAVAILLLVFTTLFVRNVRHDFPLIFQKDLLAHDESSNSVVAANITRKFFPPMVRTNPLVEQQGNWMEGPYWQHIPPMFVYVPYVFFQLDGQITIEMKRLSYAFLIWLTGILFISLVYAYSKSLWGALSALIATIFWISTPFTHELITGFAFGVSDIVLAFTVVLGLDGVLWYLHKEKEGRLDYPWWKIGAMAILVSLPIMAKSMLGAIPATIFFLSLLIDYKRLSKKVLVGAGFFAGVLALYYLPLYFTSPETFKSEILVSFFHASNYEGWGRPWHNYISNYLPQRYLLGWTWIYFTGLIFSAGYLYFGKLERIQKLLIGIPLLWFVWNLVAISLIESKIANFIFQSYLLSLFAIVYAVVLFLKSIVSDGIGYPVKRFLVPAMLIISIQGAGYEATRFVQQFKVQRAQAYYYQTEHEKFYQAAEQLQKMGVNQNDLVIVRVSDNDCWFRYSILFLTGAESKTLLELYFGFDPNQIKSKYNRMYIIFGQQESLPKIGGYSYTEFDLNKMDASQVESALNAYITIHKQDLEQNILRIKKDKTSCQWLVPDPILNAP